MVDINPLVPLQVQPNRNVLQPGDRNPTPIYFLRGNPQVFISQLPGGPSAMSFVATPLPYSRNLDRARPGPHSLRLVQLTPALLQASGLVHTRALGAPKVNPKVVATGLVQTRALGAPTVVPPPTTPPVIPPTTPPVEPTRTPRNLRYVERRNKPPRN